MEFIRLHQLNIMLFMSGICGILAISTFFIRSLPDRKKSILALMELAGMLLLLIDRLSYHHRGDTSEAGYYIVRFSNGLVFFLTIFLPHLVTQYLKDICRNEGGLEKTPLPLRLCEVLFFLGTVLIVLSQFTGLYYTFDEHNTYHRSSGYVLAYLVPILIVLLQEVTIVRCRRRLQTGLVLSLSLSIALPMLVSVAQIYHYGISLTGITMVLVVIVFHMYALTDLSRALEQARTKEIEFYREAREKEAAMFEQTAEALAGAIDAKDKYTHGHSARVAAISRLIAQRAGLPAEECEQVYFAGLLHDIGKIGVRDDIITKVGRLTEEEFAQMKLHPTLGHGILSRIRQSPSLCLGAWCHHERYDGTGYPRGLKGGEIPVIARIIAVADAYDAMSSTRSYRASLPPEKTRAELEKGMGTQFDPAFASILLDLIDSDEVP